MSKRDSPKADFSLETRDEFKGNSVNLPRTRHRKGILEDPAKRKTAGELLYELCKDMKLPRCKSNAEFVERIEEYFVMISAKEFYPTIEHLALYCGYSTRGFLELRNGNRRGHTDKTEMGDTTQEIVNRAVEAVHAFDAGMAYKGEVNFLTYCFRSKNYYNMHDKTEIAIGPSDRLSKPQTPEEIAAMLPDAQYEAEGEVR